MKMNGGITAEPYPLGVGDELRVSYSGLLNKQGADKVYLHVGYGSENSWADIGDYEMARTSEGWETVLKVHRGGNLNLCFRDRANNWDNNNGHNWTLKVDPNRFRYS